MLLSTLPRESATMLALTDGDALWGLSDHLLAAIAEAVNAGNWQRGSGKGPKPRRIPRPGVKDPNAPDRIGGKTTYTTDEIDRLLNAEWVDVGGDDEDGGA